jgi:hypothetical protein
LIRTGLIRIRSGTGIVWGVTDGCLSFVVIILDILLNSKRVEVWIPHNAARDRRIGQQTQDLVI